MRLSHLKLSGFKSFVDPTTIPVPGRLVAVVGPNGCGKSNVIDAVRWVLGESSAKQLRGESMTDVIFNGSTSRKPVSRASVELLFDNSAGRAAGQWSQFGEISIKRVLTRQGESSYYINNIACRRRDIADLFMGTGVGKGGYAVIEQGMISRIIEARPEELRAFLEEAAGVSKYKERRRETEHRLADTRDNLLRLDDICQELGKQLERLAGQAEVARQYHELQARLTERQNLLALLRKTEAARDAAERQGEIAAAQTGYEARMAQLRALEAETETQREAHYAASDAMQQAQLELSDASASVARLEQQLLHLRETRQRLTQQAAQYQQQLAQHHGQQQANADAQRDWRQQREEARYQLEEASAELARELTALPQLEADSKQLDAAFQQAQMTLSQARQARQLTEQQLQHLARTLEQIKQRRERLQHELRHLQLADDALLHDLREQLAEIDCQVEELACERDSLDSEGQQLDEARQQLRRELDRLRGERSSLAARAEALASLQQQLDQNRQLQGWLRQQGLDSASRLFQQLHIEAGWETAVEALLRERLNAIVHSQLPASPAPARLTVLNRPVQPPPAAAALGLPLLRGKIQSDDAAVSAALDHWLLAVYCLDSADELAGWQERLTAGALLVCPAGHAASACALHYYAAEGELAGVLARQRELGDLQGKLAVLTPHIASYEAQVAQLEQQRQAGQQQLRTVRDGYDRLQRERAGKQVELARLSQQHEAARQRQQALEGELRELAAQLAEESEQQLLCEEERQAASAQLAPAEAAVEAARLARLEAETGLDLQRGRQRQAERAAQEAKFAEQAAHARLTEIDKRQRELAEQQDESRYRLEETLLELEGIDESDFDTGFQAAVNRRAEKERQLAGSRDQFNHLASQLRAADVQRLALEAELEPARERISELKLKLQEAQLAAERYEQELADAAADEASLLPLLHPGMKVGSLSAEIGRLAQSINALGAVNLAALDELRQAQERKQYLDSQSDDLRQAMATLEEAIAKIDGETRTLLQSTYDQVNATLQELFPALFGGGHAELLLTGDDLLDAGMQIMAQPPGKKNSTIHLLSGGEKALTALSLVFSLFRLNPAPFCLLDEVDAPLDDANTGRFCELVKKMAEKTQFLYISHNKITMEMAAQLVGVTMQEKGVSRIVAVDIQQALQMREAASA